MNNFACQAKSKATKSFFKAPTKQTSPLQGLLLYTAFPLESLSTYSIPVDLNFENDKNCNTYRVHFLQKCEKIEVCDFAYKLAPASALLMKDS